jgi:hypothetical protein
MATVLVLGLITPIARGIDRCGWSTTVAASSASETFAHHPPVRQRYPLRRQRADHVGSSSVVRDWRSARPNGAVLATRLCGSRYASRDFRRYKPRLFRLSRSPLAYSRFRPLWMLVTLLMRRAAHAPVQPSSPREPRPAHRSAPDPHPCVVGGHRDSTVSRLATPAKQTRSC